jgi:hypothetical protein
VKKAVPQGKRFNNFARGFGGMRAGGYGAGMHGAPMNSQWYNANGWSQLSGMPYAAASGTTAGAWGDWYSGAANYYAHGAGNSTPYSAYSGISSAGNGYADYAQHGSNAAAARPTNGSTANNQRYQSF